MNERPKLLNMEEVCQRTTLSRYAIYKLRKAGNFPEDVGLLTKRVAFVESEVDAWINERIANREKAA